MVKINKKNLVNLIGASVLASSLVGCGGSSPDPAPTPTAPVTPAPTAPEKPATPTSPVDSTSSSSTMPQNGQLPPGPIFGNANPGLPPTVPVTPVPTTPVTPVPTAPPVAPNGLEVLFGNPSVDKQYIGETSKIRFEARDTNQNGNDHSGFRCDFKVLNEPSENLNSTNIPCGDIIFSSFPVEVKKNFVELDYAFKTVGTHDVEVTLTDINNPALNIKKVEQYVINDLIDLPLTGVTPITIRTSSLEGRLNTNLVVEINNNDVNNGNSFSSISISKIGEFSRMRKPLFDLYHSAPPSFPGSTPAPQEITTSNVFDLSNGFDDILDIVHESKMGYIMWGISGVMDDGNSFSSSFVREKLNSQKLSQENILDSNIYSSSCKDCLSSVGGIGLYNQKADIIGYKSVNGIMQENVFVYNSNKYTADELDYFRRELGSTGGNLVQIPAGNNTDIGNFLRNLR